jgi:hypothetical protein
MASKPSSKTNWTVGNPSFGTVTIEPNAGKKQTGWQAAEKPGHQYMNWVHYITNAWVEYFEDPIGQIATVNFAASPYSASSLNRWLAVDTSSGAVTINLPAVASNSGVEFLICKTTSDANAVTIDGNASETINGQLTKVLNAQYDFVILKQMGSGWVIVASKANPLETRAVSSNTTLTSADNGKVILLDSISAAFNVTLPSPSIGFTVSFKCVNGSLGTNAVTLVRSGSEKIENLAASYVFESAFGSWELITNGTDWFLG